MHEEFGKNGIFLEGVKYQYLRNADSGGIVLGKCKDEGCISLFASKQSIVIGQTVEGGGQGDTNHALSGIDAYLEQNGL